MNNGSINGFVINGTLAGSYASANIVCNATSTSAAAGILYIAAALVGVSPSWSVEADREAIASAPIAAYAEVSPGGGGLYVLKLPGAAVNADASVQAGTEQTMEAGADLLGQGWLAPFQGDGTIIQGSAAIDAGAGILHPGKVAASATGAIQPAAILAADGVKPLTGSATVYAVPSYRYQNGDTDHDGHSPLAGTGVLAIPGDPLFKPGVGLIEPTATVVADATLKTGTRAAFVASVQVQAEADIEQYYSVAFPFPKAAVTAAASIKAAAFSSLVADGSVHAEAKQSLQPRIDLSAIAEITVDAGTGIKTDAVAIGEASVLIEGDQVHSMVFANITPSVSVVASMISNPRSRAIPRRTCKVPGESRGMKVAANDRVIKVRAA